MDFNFGYQNLHNLFRKFNSPALLLPFFGQNSYDIFTVNACKLNYRPKLIYRPPPHLSLSLSLSQTFETTWLSLLSFYVQFHIDDRVKCKAPILDDNLHKYMYDVLLPICISNLRFLVEN